MRKKGQLRIFLFLSIVWLACSAFAQQTLKVGVINSLRAFETSAEGKKALAQLRDRDQKIRNDLAKMDDQIRTLETKLSTQRLTLTDETRIELQSELEKKRTERTRYEEDSSRDIQQLQFKLSQKIRNEMIAIIDQLAKEKGYDLILDLTTAGVVYFNAAIDVTDEVVKRYDASKATVK